MLCLHIPDSMKEGWSYQYAWRHPVIFSHSQSDGFLSDSNQIRSTEMFPSLKNPASIFSTDEIFTDNLICTEEKLTSSAEQMSLILFATLEAWVSWAIHGSDNACQCTFMELYVIQYDVIFIWRNLHWKAMLA